MEVVVFESIIGAWCKGSPVNKDVFGNVVVVVRILDVKANG